MEQAKQPTIKTKKYRNLWIVLLAGVVIVVCVVEWMTNWKAENTVLIDNIGDHPISDVVVVVNGDKVNFSSLPGHSSRLVKVNVKGESGIGLRFKDYFGRDCDESVGVYIEGGTGRDVHLSIDSESKIRVLSVQ